MRTVADHQDAVRALLAPLASRGVEVWSGSFGAGGVAPSALGRVLAVDVMAPIDLPPFDNSQMDGYAVRSAEISAGVSLTVADRIAAGSPVEDLAPGTAAPIMTGAAVPSGADAIIPIEASTPDSFQDENAGAVVGFGAPVNPGTFVRPRGSDLAMGSLLLAAGTRLGAAQWGVLASAGVTSVELVSKLRVLIVSTGDELQQPGEPLASGQIYDSNSAAMGFAVTSAGAVVSDSLTVPDDAHLVRSLLASRVSSVDLILTTGGVSKGAYEVVRDVFEHAGVTFSSVAMQPGGPQGHGVATIADDTGSPVEIPVVAFPGNPVSALVSFEVFLRDALLESAGLPSRRRVVLAPLAAALESPEGKHQVRRGRLDAAGRVELVGGPSSHLLHGYASSTLLIHIPLGVSKLDAGDEVEIWSIDD